MKEYEIVIKVSYDRFGGRSLSFVSPADAEEGIIKDVIKLLNSHIGTDEK